MSEPSPLHEANTLRPESNPPPSDAVTLPAHLAGAAGAGATPGCDAPGSSLAELAGVPGYQILGELGRGGMGVVYKALQTRLHRVVALKMILAGGHAGHDEVLRFLAEAEAFAALQHPSIVQLFEFGKHNGLPYFTLEFVPGGSLAQRIKQSPLPPAEAARTVEHIARAVHYAHEHGIVHRDLKPHNVLLAENDTPKITDFGLAKRTDVGFELTLTGTVLGTPSYLAPEQARGEGKHVGPLTDVYALGAILYECLTGRPPFHAATHVDTLYQVIEKEPVPVRSLQPLVPADLETICHKCLQKDPRRRYASAAALADDLAHFLAGEPIVARPAGRVERTVRWCRRYPVVAGLGSTTVLLLATLLIVATIGYWKVSVAHADAEEQRKEAIRLRDDEASARRKEVAARHEADRQSKQARASLRQSLWHQAQALRQSSQAGRRDKALVALKQAAAIGPGADLRAEFIQALDLPDLQPLPTKTKSGSAMLGLFATFSGHGEGILSIQNGRLEQIDLSSGNATESMKGLERLEAWSLSFDHDLLLGRLGNAAGATLWNVKTKQALGTLKDARNSPVLPQAAAFSRRGDMLAVAAHSPIRGRFDVLLFDVPALTRIASWDVEAESLDCLSFSRTGTLLAASIFKDQSHLLSLWNVSDGKELESLTVEPNYERWEGSPKPRRIDFSPDGALLAVATSNGAIRLWDVGPLRYRSNPRVPAEQTHPRPHRSVPAHLGESWAVQFSPDGAWLATTGGDGRLAVWDASTGQLACQSAVTGASRTVEWSPSGERLLCDAGARQRLWQFLRPLGRVYVPATEVRLRQRVLSLEFSPDERYLAFGRDTLNNGLHVVDLRHPDDGSIPLRSYNQAQSLAFAPDGNRLVKSSVFESEMWTLPTHAAVDFVYPSRGRNVRAVAFNRQGERVAVGSQSESRIQVIDPASGKQLWSASTAFGTSRYAHFAFTPDGKCLLGEVHPPDEYHIQARDTVTGKLLYERPNGTARLFFRDGRPMSLRFTTTLTVQDLDADRLLEPVRKAAPGMKRPEHQFVISGDGNVCAETRTDGEVVIWDLARKSERTRIRRAGLPSNPATQRNTGSSFSIVFTPVSRLGAYPQRSEDREPQVLNQDGSRFAGFDAGFLKIWDTANGKELGRLRYLPWRFQFAPGADARLLLLDPLGRLWSWTPASKNPTRVCVLQMKSGTGFFDLGSFRISPDARRIAYLSTRSQSLYYWDASTGELLRHFPVALSGSNGPRYAINFDGSRIAVMHEVERPNLWIQDTGKELLSLDLPRSYWNTRHLRLSRDAHRLVVVDDSTKQTSIKVLNVPGGATGYTLTLPESPDGFDIASDGSLLAIGLGKQVQIHDVNARQLSFALEGHEGPLTAMAFDGAARLLATLSSSDGTVRLWDLSTRSELTKLKTGRRRLSHVALSRSGRWLAAGDGEGQVRLWDLAEMRGRLKEAALDWEGPSLPQRVSPTAGSAAEYLEIARRHHLHKNYTDAIAAYDKALAHDPADALALRDRGEARFELSEFDAAIADFEKARALSPQLPLYAFLAKAFEARGEARAQQGKYKEAAADFSRLLEIWPTYHSRWEQLALTLVASGDLDGYRKFCTRLVERQAGITDASEANNAVWCSIFAPKPVADAEKLLLVARKTLADDPEDFNHLNTLGAALYRAGKSEESIRVLEEGIRLEGKGGSGWDWIFLAMAHQERGRSAQAKKWLAKADAWFQEFLEGKSEAPRSRPQPWNQRLQVELLLKEARELVDKPLKTKP